MRADVTVSLRRPRSAGCFEPRPASGSTPWENRRSGLTSYERVGTLAFAEASAELAEAPSAQRRPIPTPGVHPLRRFSTAPTNDGWRATRRSAVGLREVSNHPSDRECLALDRQFRDPSSVSALTLDRQRRNPSIVSSVPPRPSAPYPSIVSADAPRPSAPYPSSVRCLRSRLLMRSSH